MYTRGSQGEKFGTAQAWKGAPAGYVFYQLPPQTGVWAELSWVELSWAELSWVELRDQENDDTTVMGFLWLGTQCSLLWVGNDCMPTPTVRQCVGKHIQLNHYSVNSKSQSSTVQHTGHQECSRGFLNSGVQCFK